ncbi:MAG: tetratricopeptide repeat protein [Candidatus Zixiibacteriota bacterium]
MKQYSYYTKSVSLILTLLLLLLAGCSQSYYNTGRKLSDEGQYDKAVEAFYNEIAANPQSAVAWRELGVAYYRMDNLEKAEDALEQANTIMPDSRTHLFFGLIYEKQGDYEKAIDAYTASLNLNPGKTTRELVNSHLDALVYKKLSSEVSMAIANEDAIEASDISPNAVAVVNFDGSHLEPEMAPLAVGLAEFTSADLAKVKSLDVVERLKIDVILDELKLGESGYVDPSTAPRMGKLLGSDKVITGSLLSVGDDGFRLDGVIVSATDTSTRFTESSQGKIQQIFDIEKQFVFSIIDSLGITLTAAERDAIKQVPTESYLAFLSYSRGLFYQQRGMHQAARQEFQNALKHDAGFQAAQTQLTKPTSAASAESYDQTQQALESFATGAEGELEAIATGLDSRLTTILLSSGVLPNAIASRLATSQPQVGSTGTVIITVELDNE